MTADVDAEREVDFGRLAGRVLTRWWLPVGGLIVGVIVGYLLTLGGTATYRAEALVSLGTPFTQSGQSLQGLNANPRIVNEIMNSEATLRRAAEAGGPSAAALRGKVAARTIGSGIPGKLQGPQVMGISVKGSHPARVADAANSISKTVINRTATFVTEQIDAYRTQLATQNTRLASLGTRITELQKALAQAGLPELQRLVLVSYLDNAEQRQGSLLDDKASTQQQLLLATSIEAPKILSPAVAVQTTPRSRHNSMAVGGLVGLILGLLAALCWDWVAARTNRRPSS